MEFAAREDHGLDFLPCFKIMIAMLENLQGRIDEAVQFIVGISMKELKRLESSKTSRSMCLQTLAMSMWYNSALTFQIL